VGVDTIEERDRGRSPGSESENRPMHLLLLRHGQTPSNVAGQLDTGFPGAPLTELGQRQAAAIPGGLEARGLPLPESIAVSTLVRTQLTGAPLARAVGAKPDVIAGLAEITAGDLEMLADRDSQTAYNETTLAWGRGDLDVRMPGGESGREFVARYDAAILRATPVESGDGAGSRSAADTETGAGSRTVAVVSHGAAIRVWVALRAQGAEAEFAATHQLLNTGVAHLESLDEPDAEGRSWRLATWVREPTGGDALEDDTADDPTGRATADDPSPDDRP
jgi:probable phosphoglycerate mutase